MVLGAHHPLPVILDWKDLPEMIHGLRRDWVMRSGEIQNWWISYKWDFLNKWMRTDLRYLRGENAHV
jgi:hypothetical protein